MKDIHILGLAIAQYRNIESGKIEELPLVDTDLTRSITNKFAAFYARKGRNISAEFKTAMTKADFVKHCHNMKGIKNSSIFFIFNLKGILSAPIIESEDYDGPLETEKPNEGIQLSDDVLMDWEFNNLIHGLDPSNEFYILIDACYAAGMSPRTQEMFRTKPIWEINTAKILTCFSSNQTQQTTSNPLMRFFREIFPLIDQECDAFVRDLDGLTHMADYYNQKSTSNIVISAYNQFKNNYYFK